MKKSLVIMTVLVALVAFSASVMAADKACPAPMKCEYSAPVKPMPGPKPVYPVPTKPKPGKCVTVPCPPVQVFQPGPPFAMAEIPTVKKEMVETDVLRLLCAGKAKGVCPIGCEKIKWSCEWSTMEQCGKVKYAKIVPDMKKVPIAVKQKLVPVKPTCALF